MKEKILVLIKTYPNLSKTYEETVCVAGITDKGEWRRLYPVPFRKMEFTHQFHKYDWISVDTEKNSKEKLQRKESHKSLCGIQRSVCQIIRLNVLLAQDMSDSEAFQ